jgi:hypothetical protein
MNPMNNDQAVLALVIASFVAALIVGGQVALIIAKALGLISWGWGFIFLPIIILVGTAIFIAGIWAIATLVASLYD